MNNTSMRLTKFCTKIFNKLRAILEQQIHFYKLIARRTACSNVTINQTTIHQAVALALSALRTLMFFIRLLSPF